MTENNHNPTQEEINALAQQYSEEEGKPEGKAGEHWTRAEEQLRQRQAAAMGEAPAA